LVASVPTATRSTSPPCYAEEGDSRDSVEESDEEQPGVILDYDQEGNVIGIEILNASRQISQWQQLSL